MSLPAVLGGCATIEGAPRRVIDDQRSMDLANAHPMDKAVRLFHAASDTERQGMSPQQYRDMVVSVYLNAIDARYYEFRSRISSERRELDSGIDIAVLTLTNAITAAATHHARDLAAIASTFGGAGRALNRDLFFDRALPALLSAMDTGRLRVLARIQQNLGLDAGQYPLATAFADLNAYEMAGSLDRAIEEVSAQVAGARQAAEQELQTVVHSCRVTDPESVTLNSRIGGWVRILAQSGSGDDRTTLQQIGRTVGLSADAVLSVTPLQLSSLIQGRLQAGVDGQCDPASITALIARIEAATRRTVPPPPT